MLVFKAGFDGILHFQDRAKIRISIENGRKQR